MEYYTRWLRCSGDDRNQQERITKTQVNPFHHFHCSKQLFLSTDFDGIEMRLKLWLSIERKPVLTQITLYKHWMCQLVMNFFILLRLLYTIAVLRYHSKLKYKHSYQFEMSVLTVISKNENKRTKAQSKVYKMLRKLFDNNK